MNFDDFYLIIDFSLFVLLLIVLFYAVKLNKNIIRLKNNKAELKKLLNGFIISTKQAENAIENLKVNTHKQSLSMDDALSQAKKIISDLNFKIMRSEKMAIRLEQAIEANLSLNNNINSPNIINSDKNNISSNKDTIDVSNIDKKHDDLTDKLPIKGKSKSDLLKMLKGMR